MVDAAMAIKLFSITVQSNTILSTNIHSYLVVCETLFDNRRKGENGNRVREKGEGGMERREIRREKSGVRGLERKGEGENRRKGR